MSWRLCTLSAPSWECTRHFRHSDQGGDSDHQPPKDSRVGEWISEAALNLLNLILLGTLCPQVEKERELELGEKLNEQRKILEGEHVEALRGKEKMHLEGCGPDSSVPPAELTWDSHFPLPPTSGP